MFRKRNHNELDGSSIFLAIGLGATLGTGTAVLGFIVVGLIDGSNINHATPVLSLVLLTITAICATHPRFYDGDTKDRPPLEMIFWIELGLLAAGLIVIFCRPYGFVLLLLLWS